MLKSTVSAAIQLLEKHGWIQGHTGNKKLGFCIFGAFNAVDAKIPIHEYDQLGEFLSNYSDYRVSYWNDKPGRTKAEVIAKLQAFHDTKAVED